MLDALEFAHEEIKRLVAFQKAIRFEIGKEKVEPEIRIVPEEIDTLVRSMAEKDLVAAVFTHEKLERAEKINAINERVIEELTEKFKEDEDFEDKMKYVNQVLGEYCCGRGTETYY